MQDMDAWFVYTDTMGEHEAPERAYGGSDGILDDVVAHAMLDGVLSDPADWQAWQ